MSEYELKIKAIEMAIEYKSNLDFDSREYRNAKILDIAKEYYDFIDGNEK